MDDAGKIALGFAGAALVAAVTSIGYREFERSRDIAEATAIMQAISQPIVQTRSVHVPDPEYVRLEVQGRRIEDTRYGADAAERQRRSIQLASNERCIGGVVIFGLS